ncbi:Uncharacterised protein [Mycobacterium tuberculosis]|nr:Uncharacterised protein [Mycobacterium tuberculosis]
MIQVEVCHLITNFLFNHATERTNPHDFVVTFFYDIIFSRLTNYQVNVFLSQGLVNFSQHQIYNLRKIFLSQV